MIKEMQEFIESKLLDENKSKQTVDNYTRFLNEFCTITGISTLDEFLALKQSNLQAYIRELNKKNQGSSVLTKVVAVQSFYTYLIRLKITDNNLMKRMGGIVFPKRSKKEVLPPTTEDVKNILRELKEKNETYYLLLAFLSQSGVRINEALSIKISSFHDNQVKILGKGDKERTIFLSSTMMQIIDDYIVNHRKAKPLLSEKEYLEHGLNTKFKSYEFYVKRMKEAKDLLFLSTHGVKMDKSSVRKTLKSYTLKAGIDIENIKCNPHKIRSSFATEGMLAGISVSQMQSILGHADPKTTMGYSALSRKQKEMAFQNVFDIGMV